MIGKDRASVAELIGKGGEGEVYAIKGRAGLAVKIYKANLRPKRENKVRAMVGEGLAVQTELIAYPGDIVTDRKGSFLGFVMRLVSGYRPLHELYSPKSRLRFFPKADYRFVIHVASNVARAVGKVHQTGCVIGDLNHSGILVARDATVALIDADSFQFSLNGTSYPCVVGVPDFTPPELHGKKLATVERTIEHDNFGLAVAIFQLLFMGKHPYAGIRKGSETSIGEDIAQNRFAYSLVRQAQTQTKPPPGALALDLFMGTIGDAFENAFGLAPSARPSASDWIQVLSKLEASLNRCSSVRSHYYPSTAKSCVWCKLSAQSGLDMFPDFSAVAPNISTDSQGTEQAIREILAFRFPVTGDLLPAVSVRDISPSLREARNGKRGHMLLGLLMIGGAVAGFIVAAPVWFVWIGLAFWGWSFVSDREVSSGPFLKAFKDADERVQQELDGFLQRNGLTEVVKVRGDLDDAISAYKGHDDALARQVMILKSNREARQRQAFLDQFSVRRANISGIGPAKTATLISFGIETAGDVKRSSVLQVPGFGEVMTGKLMAWRKAHESRFRYNRAPNAQDIADEKALRGRFMAEKAKLEATIRNGLGTLRNARAKIDALPARTKNDPALLNALKVRGQAERDLIELSAPVPPSTVSLALATSTRQQQNPQGYTKPAQQNTVRTPGVPSCPRCNSAMRRRSGRYGKFWGCSRYPSCKGTRKI